MYNWENVLTKCQLPFFIIYRMLIAVELKTERRKWVQSSLFKGFVLRCMCMCLLKKTWVIKLGEKQNDYFRLHDQRFNVFSLKPWQVASFSVVCFEMTVLQFQYYLLLCLLKLFIYKLCNTAFTFNVIKPNRNIHSQLC